jgi:hypothetical protein
MLDYGTKPIVHSSVLTGLSVILYNNYITNEVFSSETAIQVVVGSDTFTESETERQKRVLKNKLMAYSQAQSIISDLKTNALIQINGAQVVTTYVGGVGTSGDALTAPGYVCVGTVMTPSAVELAGTIT